MRTTESKAKAGIRRGAPSSAAKPAKVRASGLSRERVVAESLKYMRGHPHEPFSLAQAAAGVGATKMALYRHFKDFADLSNAIVAEVLVGLEDDIPQGEDWRGQVRAWMQSIYRRMMETPQCVDMLGGRGGLSTAWMHAAAVLRRSLARGGLQGPPLSEAVFWITMTMIGFVNHTLLSPMTAQIDGTLLAIERLEPVEAAELASFAADIPAIYENALDIMMDRMLAGVEGVHRA